MYKIVATKQSRLNQSPEIARDRIHSHFKLPELAEKQEIDPVKVLRLLNIAESYLNNNSKRYLYNPYRQTEVTRYSIESNLPLLAPPSKLEPNNEKKEAEILAGLLLMKRKVVPHHKKRPSDRTLAALPFLRAFDILWDANCLDMSVDVTKSFPFTTCPPRNHQFFTAGLEHYPKWQQDWQHEELSFTRHEIIVGYLYYQFLSRHTITKEDPERIILTIRKMGQRRQVLHKNYDDLAKDNGIICIKSQDGSIETTISIVLHLIQKTLDKENHDLAYALTMDFTAQLIDPNEVVISIAMAFIKHNDFDLADHLIRTRMIRGGHYDYDKLIKIELEKAKQNEFDPSNPVWGDLAENHSHIYNNKLSLHICELIQIGQLEAAKILQEQMDISIRPQVRENESRSVNSFNSNTSPIIVEFIKSEEYETAEDLLSKLVVDHPDYNNSLIDPIIAFLQKGQTELAKKWVRHLSSAKAKANLVADCIQEKFVDFGETLSTEQFPTPETEYYNYCQVKLSNAYIDQENVEEALLKFQKIKWNVGDPYQSTHPICRLLSRGLIKQALTFSSYVPEDKLYYLLIQILPEHPKAALQISQKITDTVILKKAEKVFRAKECNVEADEIVKRLSVI